MHIKKFIKSGLNRFPYISSLYAESKLYRKNAIYPPGHFYSPIVSVDEILSDSERIWNQNNEEIAGIDLRVKEQLNLVGNFQKYYKDIPFTEERSLLYRYYFINEFYSFTDGIILYSFIRHYKPRKIIEVGSGFSSALMLDVNKLFFGDSIGLSFVEPFPLRLKSLLSDNDNEKYTLFEKKIQDVSLDIFTELDENDILFIDSSHISKTGSDVNHIIFRVLPLLKEGVIIHFHDIFFPFEYPKEWVIGGRNWNELYLLRAFLMNNPGYEILLFSHYLHTNFPEVFRNMPLAYKDGGSNFWFKKSLSQTQ